MRLLLSAACPALIDLQLSLVEHGDTFHRRNRMKKLLATFLCLILPSSIHAMIGSIR
jgi:hypothetical protein